MDSFQNTKKSYILVPINVIIAIHLVNNKLTNKIIKRIS